MRSSVEGPVLPALVLVLLLPACDARRPAVGEANSLIVAAENSLWADVGDSVAAVLEPRIRTVRPERTFQVTHVSPVRAEWRELRRFRQVLVVGDAADPWVRTALDELAGPVPEPPAILEVEDVWANNQRATILLLPESGQAAALRALLPELHELLDRRFRVYARERMFTTGPNLALADTLRGRAGFQLVVPNVYRWRQVADSAYLFVNDNPTPEQLLRMVLVTSRPSRGAGVSADDVVAWRDSLAARFYEWGQTTGRERLDTARLEQPSAGGLEVRGVWTGTIRNFPQAGPFITRVIRCPAQDRTYLVDAWLYAPGRDKYEYVIQLETILDSFECAGKQPGRQASVGRRDLADT